MTSSIKKIFRQSEDYKKIIPKQLITQAESLISFLSYYPFQTPCHCKFCGSNNFIESRFKKNNDKRNIPFFYCRSCKGRFTQTTNTIFAGILYLELIGDYARLRLAGLSQEAISEKLGFALATAKARDKLLCRVIAEKYPNLYAWWKPHQDYLDSKLSPQVAKEHDNFIKWLDRLVNKNKVTCPKCLKTVPSQNLPLPLFVCKPCGFKFEQVVFNEGRTPQVYLMKWIPFVEGLIQGKSAYSLARELGLSYRTSSSWKQKFTKQMEKLEFNQLIQWSKWQRSRCVASKAKKYREQLTKT